MRISGSPVDGSDRFIAFKRFDRYPLIVTVTSTVDSTLATWYWQVLLGALALLVVTLWGGVVALNRITSYNVCYTKLLRR